MLVLATGLCALILGAPAAQGKVVPTQITVPTVSRAADGTLTITASFTSPNPRCLPAKRFGHVTASHPPGYPQIYSPFSTNLGYGDGVPSPSNPVPTAYVPIPFTPVTPAQHSPYVWRLVLPGSTEVQVLTQDVAGQGFHTYPSTVAAARGADTTGIAPPTGYATKKAKDNFFHVNYTSRGQRRSLKCTSPNTFDQPPYIVF
jgi:hypothetical protein